MSTTPRYSTVRISKQRAREAAAAAARERGRVEEAARRQREAELQAHRRKHEQRQRVMVERHRAQRRQIHEKLDQASASAVTSEPDRRAGAPDRRQAAARPQQQAESRPVEHEIPPREHSPAQPVERIAPLAVEKQQADDGQHASGQQRDQTRAPREPAADETQLSLVVAEPAIVAHADAQTLIAALSRWTSFDETVEQLREAGAKLAGALDAGDERTTIVTTAAVSDLVTGAQAEHDAFQETRARRRIIATSVAAALPECYRIGPLTEHSDGSVHFRASGPDDKLQVAVCDDGSGKDIVGYQAEDGEFLEQLDVPPGMDDCPGLTRDLEETHDRATADGFAFGPVTSRHIGAGRPDRAQRNSAARRQSSS